MKHLFLLLSFFIGINAIAQKQRGEIIPVKELQQAADRFANQKWGNTGPAQAIPYYDASDNIVAYSFNYALGKDFPTDGNFQSYNEADENGVSKVARWGNGEYANLVLGNNRTRISLIRYINALSDEYAFADEIEAMATEALNSEEVHLDKVYYYNPLLKYYKYDSNGSSVYVRIFPPRKVLSEKEFAEEFLSIYDKDVLLPKAEEGSWEYYLGEQNTQKSVNTASYIAHNEVMPYLDWMYGCSPTSGGMILGYWDNYSQYSSNDYGNLSKYHFQRTYTPGGTDYNVSTAQQWCSTYMNTDLSDGNTSEGNIGPGMTGAANSANCGSYNFSQWTSASYATGTNTTKLNLFKGEVDNNRPSITSIPGHSVACVGYDIVGANTFMVVHNTWNEGLDDHWNYTQIDRLIFLYPGGQYGTHLKLTSPIGDPAYNHNGNGEDIFAGNVWEITWNYESLSGSYCKLYYSTNAGSTWTSITTNAPNNGSYLWTTPNITTAQGRVKIEVYSSGGVLQASDGSWGNFSLVTGGSIYTLNSDVSVSTTDDPTYYKINHPYSTWGAVGIRSNNLNTTNWSMRFYSTDDFSTEVESSTWATNVDYVVFDQHHLSGNLRGIKTYLASGSGDGRTEFEGFTETLVLNTPQVHAWPADDVVEIWDVSLAAGTYKFTMNYNSGSANLDMALFSSYGGPYYQNRGDYLAHSSNGGTSNESFFVTVPASDYYGFIVWANDANAANVTITVVPTTAGLWEGDVSSDWNTAGNWNDNNVPTSATDVVIPAGTPYGPYVNLAYANAKTLTVESGATLLIGAYDLDVQEEAHIYGTIAMNNINADLYCYGDIYWESGSQANMTANGEFRVYGDWNFEAGANVQLTNGNVWFVGTSTAYIRCYDADCSFNHVYSAKTAGSLIGVSYLSTDDLHINGDININSGSAFNSYSQEKIVLNGSFDNNGGHFLCNFGTFEFAGSPVDNLEPNVGDYFQNLIINVSTDVDLMNTYSDSLVIKGDLTISSGIFDSNGNTITIVGDWLNYVGAEGFLESTGKVIFDGTSGINYCYGETFYDVTKTSGATYLHFYGPTSINNNFYCYGFAWADETMYVDNLFLNSTGKFTANSSGIVNIDDLDMGFTIFGIYLYGTLFANNGHITVGDIAEDGLYGTFRVSGTNGLLDISQDASTYIDLNGTIDISSGTMNVNGGSGTSYWPYTANASITMSGGVLDFTDNSILIYNSGSYSLTTNITGGVIRTDHNLSVYDDFNPTGGTFEFYGTLDSYFAWTATNAAMYNLHINKTANSVISNANAIYISNDLTIDGGTFVSPESLYVGGDWTNNVGASAFTEGTNMVTFYGPNSANLTTNETFYNLTLDKSYANFDGLVVLTNLTVNVSNNVHIIDGTFEMDANVIADINGNLLIESGAGFNTNDAGTQVFLAGNLTDNNATITTVIGLECIASGTFTFDGASNQHTYLSAPDMEFGTVVVDKAGTSALLNHNDFRVLGNIDVENGGWDDWTTGLNYYLEGNLTVLATGGWWDHTCTLHFEGNIQQYNEAGALGSSYMSHVVINSSNTSGGVQLNSSLIILLTNKLDINAGTLWANGNLIRINNGNLDINTGAELNMDDNSELNLGNSSHLNINNGGTLMAIGSQGNEVIFESNDANFWQFNCNSGGTVAAEWCTFSEVDTWGVYIWSGGVVDTNHPFNHCTFLPGQAGGSLFWIESSQIFTVNYANFPSQGSSSYNARKGVNAGEVTFVNFLGSFSGEAYDQDSNDLLDWVNDISVTDLTAHVSCNGGNDAMINIITTGGTSAYTYLWSDGSTLMNRTGLSAGNYSVTVTDFYGAEKSHSIVVNEPAPYLINSSVTNVSCYGGSDGEIFFYLTGGTPPDILLWSNGVTSNYNLGLTAGTYSVTCTDAHSCVVTGSYTLTEPPEIIVTGVVSDATTFGGSDGYINASVSSGVPPYSYIWSNGEATQDIFGLSAGFYILSVTDAGGCTNSETFQVLDGSVPTLGVSGTVYDVSCYGDADGVIELNLLGGVAPFSFSWSNGATSGVVYNLSGGSYQVTVSDGASQTASASFTVFEPSDLTLSETISYIDCFGAGTNSISVLVSGGTPPYSYLWSTGVSTPVISGISPGSYNLTVTDDHGCFQIASYVYLSGPPAMAIASTSVDVTTNGGSDGSINIFVSGGVPPYSYIWSNGATTQNISGLSAGFYHVTAYDSNSCEAYESIEITEPGGLDEQLIDLPLGWSIMSTYINPVNPLANVVFAPVVSNTAIVKNGSGAVYWPAFGVNSIGNMILGQGYQVKMNSANDTLNVYGTAAVPEFTPVSVQAGWSIIGYLRQVPGNAITMMSPIVANVAILKSGAGAVYWPAFGVNSIGNMMPGQGYQIKMNTTSTLYYPSNSAPSKSDIVAQQPIYYTLPAPTDNNMTLGIPETAFDDLPMMGDEIGVFDNNGLLVGAGVYSGGNTALTLWGNDELSTETDGLQAGNDFSIRIWDGKSEKILTVESWSEGDGRYEENDIQIVGKLALIYSEHSAYSLDQNVPNPFKTHTRISFFLMEDSEITLTVFDILGNEIQVLARGSFPAGNHTVEMENQNFATGTYFYRLIANDFVETKQMEVGR